MSADLLRRAAAKLRDAANAAQPAPWRATAPDPFGQSTVQAGSGYDIARNYEEPACDAADAEYIALIHPPVALALAEWMELYAWLRDEGANVPMNCASKVARAILREPAPAPFEPPTCPHDTTDVERCAEGGHDQ